MSTSHGKNTVITVNGKDISAATKGSVLTRGGTVHGTTGYGVDDETNAGGLRKHSFTAEGWYDTSLVTGPRAVIKPLIMQTTTITRKPEGTGVGKPLETFQAVVEEYVETNPVDDYVSWSAKFTVSGPITDSVQ